MSGPAPSETSAILKFARACQHLDSLDKEITAFINREHKRFLMKGDVEIGQPFDPSWGTHAGRHLPARFSVILGDFLANLRASLDHAVNGLAGPNAGEYTKFPIYADRSKFKGGIKGDLEGVSRPYRTQIERMQPYHGHRRGRALALLARLRNIDEHRTLYFIPALLDHASQFPSGSQSGQIRYRDFGVLGDHTEVVIDFTPDSEPKVQGGTPYQVLFADPLDRDGHILCTRRDLTIMRDEVGTVLDELGFRPVVYALLGEAPPET